MTKVVLDSAIPFIETVLDPYATVVRRNGIDINAIDVADADALIIRTRTICNEKLLAGSKVKFIGSATIGYDHIDMEYCKKKGITVVTAEGCNAMAVVHYIAAVFNEIGGNLTKKKLGIIGVGNVGSRVALLARKLGMEVMLNDPPRAERETSFISNDLNSLLHECDIITMHTPYTKTGKYPTEKLAGEIFFEKAKHGLIFINTSRGEVVDEDALVKAIDDLKVAHSFIDVWRGEPLINHELLKRATIATPHIAGYSIQGKANGSADILRAFARFFNIEELKGWYPQGVKICENRDYSAEEIMGGITKCYNIKDDYEALLNAPEKFEEQRNRYHYREEYFKVGSNN